MIKQTNNRKNKAHIIPKSILITGCSSGIGLDTALTLHKQGFNVFATVRKKSDIEPLKAMGLNVKRLDLTDESSIENAIKWVLSETNGTLDALFNNGAYGQPGAIEDLPIEALKEQFETNFFGWHSLTQKVIPIMRQQGHGRIIQNSSVLGLVAMPYRGAYNASKFAIEGYTDTLRLELRHTNIQVVLVEPGPIATQFRFNALAKIEQYINVESSEFSQQYKPQIERLASKESNAAFTLPATAVTQKVIHALTAKKAKARYYVTTATYLMAFFKRVLPVSLLDKMLAKG